MADTKDQILDAAEKLFAEKGFAATSTRAITDEAGVNLSAVNYHFGSKQGLIYAVFKRRVRDINTERIRMLDRYEAEAGGGSVLPDKIMTAYIAPAIRVCEQKKYYMRLMGRIYSEPGDFLGKLYTEEFAEVMERFPRAIMKAVPGLSEEDFFWKAHFILGVLSHTMSAEFYLRLISNGKCTYSDIEALIRRMTDFTVAGLTASTGSSHKDATP